MKPKNRLKIFSKLFSAWLFVFLLIPQVVLADAYGVSNYGGCNYQADCSVATAQPTSGSYSTNTNGHNWLIPALIAAAILLVGAAAFALLRRHKRNNQNPTPPTIYTPIGQQ